MTLKQMQDAEDDNIRWLRMYQRTVDGLAAFAEMQAENCNREWLAMHYALEGLADMMNEDLKEREKAGGAE